MVSEWLAGVKSSIPRGFSRYYILELLKEPHTGKEIIDHAIQQSGGIWKPSPGLVYPMLGRLLDEQLIEDVGDGRYQITEKGVEVARDVDKFQDTIKKQLDVLLRIKSVGRFVAMDVLERMAIMGSALGANINNMTKQEATKYREFLQEQLQKLDEQSEKQKEIKID